VINNHCTTPNDPKTTTGDNPVNTAAWTPDEERMYLFLTDLYWQLQGVQLKLNTVFQELDKRRNTRSEHAKRS
jgi:hypothetical protein